MAKKAYIGVDGVARKIKNGYIGVDGVARKIKKAYIGIGGVARPCWNSLDFYYGIVTPLSAPRMDVCGASIKDYALFAAGFSRQLSDGYGAGYRAEVEAYNNGLTRLFPDPLTNNCQGPVSANVGNYVIFGFGTRQYSSADAYSEMLTKTTMTPPIAFNNADAASIGNYAIFSGVRDDNLVCVINDELTMETHSGLSKGRCQAATCSTDKYALFFGGFYNVTTDTSSSTVYCKEVDAFTASLTLIRFDDLPEACSSLTAAKVGEYIIVGCGYYKHEAIEQTSRDTMYVYSDSLTRLPDISRVDRASYVCAVSVGDYALFAGGYYYSDMFYTVAPIDTVVSFDVHLTQNVHGSLSSARCRHAGAKVGKYALFAGGQYRTDTGNLQTTDVIDAYLIQE